MVKKFLQMQAFNALQHASIVTAITKHSFSEKNQCAAIAGVVTANKRSRTKNGIFLDGTINHLLLTAAAGETVHQIGAVKVPATKGSAL